MAALTTNACMNSGTVREDHFYRLPDLLPEKTYPKPISGTLSVAPFNADGIYAERSLLYVDAQTPLEIKRYHYRYWATPPEHMLQQHFINYLRAGGVAENINQYQPGHNIQAVISAKLLRFERIVHLNDVEVIIKMELHYRENAYDTSPILHKTYQAGTQLNSLKFQDTAEAYGQVLKTIYDHFLEDLNKL